MSISPYWVEFPKIREEIQADPELEKLQQSLQSDPTSLPNHTLRDSLIFFKGRLVLSKVQASFPHFWLSFMTHQWEDIRGSPWHIRSWQGASFGKEWSTTSWNIFAAALFVKRISIKPCPQLGCCSPSWFQNSSGKTFLWTSFPVYQGHMGMKLSWWLLIVFPNMHISYHCDTLSLLKLWLISS